MFGKAGMSQAHRSGMRGAEKPGIADEAAREGESVGQESSEEQDLASVVGQHVHGPDENGHHHLNLSTLAEHMQKRGGRREQ